MIMALIYRNVPRKKTNEMLLLGERIDARGGASESGSSTRSCRPTSSTPRSPSGRRSWPRSRPVLMRLGKDAMYRQQDMALDDALDYLRSQLTLALLDRGHRSRACTAFFEKREPEWKGR